jgi:5-formyltetrahydrofolate cyclo-ligase
MSTDAVQLKAQLRRDLRAASARVSPAERAAASAQICQRLKEQSVWRQARAVLFYFPMQDEPDIHSLFTEALAAGKVATLPRFSGREQHYQACQVFDLDGDLQPGAFGIHEPTAVCPIFDLKKLDLVLVPGVGFALNGVRLGRGKGYYDRLLAEIAGFKCGVAFEWQLAVEIPSEPHDICLDCILTPTRWHGVTAGRRS